MLLYQHTKKEPPAGEGDRRLQNERSENTEASPTATHKRDDEAADI